VVLASAFGLIAYTWPFFVDPGAGLGHDVDAPYVFALLLPLLLAVVLAEVADGGMDSKAIAMLGVLAAAGAVLRPLSGGVTGFQPMFVVIVLGGRALGPGFGFALGASTMFASALFTGGVGPWLPFQMLAAAWMGLGAGLLPRATGRPETVLLAGYAAFAGLAYGLLLNLWFWPFTGGLAEQLAFVAGAPLGENVGRFLAFSLATSLGVDLPRAIGSAVLILVFGAPLLRALRRSARRAAFDAAPAFAPAGARAGPTAGPTRSAGAPPALRTAPPDGCAPPRPRSSTTSCSWTAARRRRGPPSAPAAPLTGCAPCCSPTATPTT
jgi:energy-coupling factor transport system substrate-specific component